MSESELKMQGAEALMTALFESLCEGFSLGRVAERFRELAEIDSGIPVLNRLHIGGGTSVNNAIFSEWEAAYDRRRTQAASGVTGQVAGPAGDPEPYPQSR